MQKSQKILIGVGAGVLALTVAAATAGPAIYRDHLTSPAAEAPQLGANSELLESGDGAASNGQALNATELAGVWTVSGDSEAGYRVDEVLNGTDVTVTGRTSEVTGSLTVDASGTVLEAADITVDVSSIATDRKSRDAYFRDQAMHVSEFPTATFRLTKPVAFDELPAAGEVVQASVTGELTLAGVTNAVDTEVSVRGDGAVTEIAGSIPIAFADYGVEAPSLGFVEVAPLGFVEFQLTATR